MYEKGQTQKKLNTLTSIVLGSFHAPWPISYRELLGVTRVQRLEDGSLVYIGTSCELDELPVTKGYVRSHLNYALLLAVPIDHGVKSKCTYVVSSDLNGSLPAMFVASSQTKQPLCSANIK